MPVASRASRMAPAAPAGLHLGDFGERDQPLAVDAVDAQATIFDVEPECRVARSDPQDAALMSANGQASKAAGWTKRPKSSQR